MPPCGSPEPGTLEASGIYTCRKCRIFFDVRKGGWLHIHGAALCESCLDTIMLPRIIERLKKRENER